MSVKIDRRKQYTRMVLKDSFIKLLQEIPLANITIKGVCEHADINRSTFYSHFTDLYDLLHQVEDDIIEDLNQALSTYSYSIEEENYQMIEKVLEYLVENRESCETLFSEHGAPSFQRKVMMLAHTHFNKLWTVESNTLPHNVEYLSQYIVNGSIHVIQIWLKNGSKESPKEMAELIQKLANRGLSSFL
ncbi:TetR/AcrR family transcriptional regulator [Caldalkalibacillus mannanilyticus]|uniref:TetR/AcrR family transcriptional regulator n=1 Tax=Caldalkalibacillus mannanilyticus TaxID=1418 RepID=UPI000469D728|nr:TetR/AcrR family transcriptional regulator [Caldalkalibacillus mannanilyticus]